MALHSATVIWERGDASFTDNQYSRVHQWRFDGGAQISASASPHVVPAPHSDAAAVDPEEVFVAALSSCHMLFFLAFAAKRGFVVDRYEDEAEGVLAKDDEGRRAITRVTLRPRVSYAADMPDADQESAMHHRAHKACFIANSVSSEIVIEPRRTS